MKLPAWTWIWAWDRFGHWALLEHFDDAGLSARQRWEVVWWSLLPGFKHHYFSPLRSLVQRVLPDWMLLAGLPRHAGGWHEIQTVSQAVRVHNKYGEIVREGTFIKVENHRVVAIGMVLDGPGISPVWERHLR